MRRPALNVGHEWSDEQYMSSSPMDGRQIREKPLLGVQHFKAGRHVYAVVGVFSTFFVVLGGLVAFKTGDQALLLMSVGAFLALLLLLRILKLEIGEKEIFYRNLSGSHRIGFETIVRAYVDVLQTGHTPQGAPRFWIETSEGTHVKVNLRTFPIRAAALLFTLLQSHDIRIDVVNQWSAQRFVKQIREAQSKLQSDPMK